MGVAVGYFDNDGRLDMLKTNFAGDYPNLYRNIGKGIFEDVAVKAGLAINPQYVGWGVGFVDLDNDGWKDVFQANGHVYPELDRREGNERYRNPAPRLPQSGQRPLRGCQHAGRTKSGAKDVEPRGGVRL